MKNKLIKTTLAECSAKDSIHLTNSDLERTSWKITGTDLFGNIIIECNDSYAPRTELPTKEVFRTPRLIEMEL